MGKIKSALELAMEKTADMAIDREKIKQKDLKKTGQVLATSIINDSEKESELKFNSFKNEDLPYIKEGMVETVLSNIRLPLYINSDDNLLQLEKVFALISEKEEVYTMIFSQLKQLFEKFTEDVQNLSDALKQQYMPVLMQKQQQYKQQTGQNIQIEPEQDPEFMDLFSKNRKSIEEQYNNVIAQAKDELSKII